MDTSEKGNAVGVSTTRKADGGAVDADEMRLAEMGTKHSPMTWRFLADGS
jgi:hypothetical protein